MGGLEQASHAPRLPEAEVVHACARVAITPPGHGRLAALLARPLDWARLLSFADRHGLIPLLNHHLGSAPEHAVPAEAREALRDRARAIVGRNLLMTSELVRLVHRLESRGIAALPYKGPLLALAAYGSVGLRSFDDLDLLIPQRHVPEATRLLLEDGYRSLYTLTAGQEAAHLESECEYILERDDVRVELHWQVLPEYFALALDLDGLWARAGSITLAGATLRTLAPEDLLLVLSVHGAKHCWDRLEWVASYAELVRRHPEADWGEIRRAAERAGARRVLDLGLWLVHDLMNAPLDPATLAAIARDPTARALAREVADRLLDGDSITADRPREIRFHLRARDRLRDRVRYALRLGTTQTLGDWDLIDLPPGARGAYRVLRPLRLLGKFGPTAIGRVLTTVAAGPRH